MYETMASDTCTVKRSNASIDVTFPTVNHDTHIKQALPSLDCLVSLLKQAYGQGNIASVQDIARQLYTVSYNIESDCIAMQ